MTTNEKIDYNAIPMQGVIEGELLKNQKSALLSEIREKINESYDFAVEDLVYISKEKVLTILDDLERKEK